MSDYHPCVAYDGPEFAHFCEHINARLCVKDFLDKTRELGTKGYNPNAQATLVFPIKHEIAVKPLFDSDYAVLVRSICNRIAITPHALDSFRSELDDNLMAFFIHAISAQSKQVSVQPDPSRPAFLVQLPDLLSDLILAPLSQLHSAVVENCRYFAELIEAVGGDPTRLFLNAHASSAFSMFVLIWVANRMQVPLAYGDPNTSIAVI
jgi:hypothetical protein